VKIRCSVAKTAKYFLPQKCRVALFVRKVAKVEVDRIMANSVNS